MGVAFIPSGSTESNGETPVQVRAKFDVQRSTYVIASAAIPRSNDVFLGRGVRMECFVDVPPVGGRHADSGRDGPSSKRPRESTDDTGEFSSAHGAESGEDHRHVDKGKGVER